MAIRADLEPLLEATRAEAKRWAAVGPNLLLLALVVARRHEAEFSAAFGERGQAEIESRLAVGGTAAQEAEVLFALEEAGVSGGVEALIKGLRQALMTSDGTLPEDASQARPAPQAEAIGVASQLTPHVRDLTCVVTADAKVLGREDVVDEILTVIGRTRPGLSLLIGAPGSGRTSTAAAIATRLADPDYRGPLAGGTVFLATAGVLTDKGAGRALRLVLEGVASLPDAVLFVDDFDVLAGLSGQGANLEVLSALEAAHRQEGTRVVLSCATAAATRLGVHNGDLAGRVIRTHLRPLSPSLLNHAAQGAAAVLATSHGVSIPEDVVVLSAAAPRDAEHWAQPGLAVRRLDAACVRARLRQDTSVRASDLSMPGESPVAAMGSDELADRLERRVVGQREGVRTVAQRLSLTRSGLDLRPERPDGAFLLVGPTGVGKTELAKAMCAEVFGDESRLIRLDMSEYAHDWAMSRIIGPMPGFVGSTEPDSWLTTRVRHQPQTVVLLDEIEKAHPTVWNAFLQVLDAGRLSDSRGEVADFSKTIVVMTSNLGADAFSNSNVGFKQAAPGHEAMTSRVLDAVKTAMAPELVNRLDAVVVFHPLAASTMLNIAAKEVGAVLDRLSTRGYRLSVESSVLDHLAETGYDARYGARHLQRNIERLLLQPLAGHDSKDLRADLVDGRVVWEKAGVDAKASGLRPQDGHVIAGEWP